MPAPFQKILLALLVFAINECVAFQASPRNSVLSSGKWYKFAITASGVYKIDRDMLMQAGIDANVDPRKIKIYGNGGKQLPQHNGTTRPIDLLENHILITGESDGSFDSGDLILFYGQGPDTYYFDVNADSYFYKTNPYSDSSFYFLTISATNGSRISEQSNLGDNHPIIDQVDVFRYHERDEINKLQALITSFGGSGREWYGEVFDATLSRDLQFSTEGILAGSNIKLISSVMAESFAPSEFVISLNNSEIGEQSIASVPDTRYGDKGAVRTDTFNISAAPGSEELLVNLTYVKNPASRRSIGYLDYLLINYHQALVKGSGQLEFVSSASLANSISTFKVENANSSTLIWDVTDPVQVKQQSVELAASITTFGAESNVLKKYILYDQSADPLVPHFVGPVPNQDLQGNGSANLIIVTHPSFKAEAERLADLRRNIDGLSAHVYTSVEVFNEFSSGTPDPSAIRDFMKYLHDLGGTSSDLRYLLLFGKTSYDYKDRSNNNTNFVLTYVSRNSLDPLETYSSDDYFGFLDDDEGEWIETNSGDHLMDIGVGRLPVKTQKESQVVVDKLEHYSTNNDALGKWRNEIVFVADDGDGNIHQDQADQMADFLDTAQLAFHSNKLYLDAFPQIVNPGGENAPEAIESLQRSIDKGALIINYTGHGAEGQWMQEDILNNKTIESLSNFKNLPLFVTATCEFGRHDDPFQVSGGERIVLNKTGGAIGIVTTARPVFSSTNFKLNKAFYDAVFRKENNEFLRLGDIFLLTKNNSINGPNNRNFSLLADPSMRLAYPKYSIEINSINNKPFVAGQDTLTAVSQINLGGVVTDSGGSAVTSFDGTLYATIYDKSLQKETLGSDGPAYQYQEQSSAIFRGQASIDQGQFSFDFVVPKDIAFQLDQGKINLYAAHESDLLDANGATADILVGGTGDNLTTDTTPPEINVFFENSSFRDGGVTTANTLLLVKLTDDSGINISNAGIGHEITAELDSDEVFILNDYFLADRDNFRSGWVTFPINNLSKGEHTVTVKGWDNHNNSTQTTLRFFVGENPKIELTALRNYPNPFFRNESTRFAFEHNREGEDLEVELQIINRNGQVIRSDKWLIEDSEPLIDGLEWDGSNNKSEKVDGGLYLYMVQIRSLKDGSRNRLYQRLVVN